MREAEMNQQKYTLSSIEKLATNMTCEQCDEMFQECIAEVDPDSPGGYEVCQLLWDHCKASCGGNPGLTRSETRVIVKNAYASALRG
jgi:hypothetical protein